MAEVTAGGARPRLFWLAPLLAVPALAAYLAGPVLDNSLRFEREAILAGEVWRLFTGHFVHLSVPHLLLNLVALILLTAGFGWHMRVSLFFLLITVVVLALGVSGGFLLANPELDWYVGLSGILHGLTVLVAVRAMREERVVGLLLLCGVAIKVGWEQLIGTDPNLEVAIGGSVIVDAHLYGFITALALQLVIWLHAKWKKS